MSLILFRSLLFFLYGIVIGSFLNVVIYRVPLNLPIAHGARSMCPKCGHMLHAPDLVPVFSYLFLKGKCRYCHAPISKRYPLVELLTGVLFMCSAVVYDISFYAVLLCIYFSVLIIAWFIDLDHTFIPDRVHVIILVLAVWSYFCGPFVSLKDRLIGGAALGIFMFLISYFTGGGIGLGDVKLLASSGLLLGWKLAVPAFFLAYVIAVICLLPSIISGKAKAGFQVPMAPYFAVSLSFMALFGNYVIRWYLGLF